MQLSYEHTRDGSSKHFNLSAYAHHADSVRFIVRRHHDPLAAPGRYNDHVTDTDLHPEDASHPWEVDRRRGGKAVLKAIRSSLQRKGTAIVRVIARNGDARDKAKVTDRRRRLRDGPAVLSAQLRDRTLNGCAFGRRARAAKVAAHGGCLTGAGR